MNSFCYSFVSKRVLFYSVCFIYCHCYPVNFDEPKLIKYSDEIINAGEGAKKLTSKLLEFSCKAPSSNETTDINQLINNMQHMQEKTLIPHIKLVLELEENLWPVWIDKARLEDAILNMGINSMHAMSETGTLTLSTYNMQLADKDIHYRVLSVILWPSRNSS